MTRIKSVVLLISLALGLGFTSSAHAVDLTNRLGIGYSQQLGSVDIPMITTNYYMNSNFAISAALGVDTEDDNSRFGALVKIRRIIFTEKQMNFYMGAMAGLTTHEEKDATTAKVDDKSNFELAALIGGEFFFTGLDSLAFFFETGVGVISGDGGSRFRTIGNGPFQAGITFYF